MVESVKNIPYDQCTIRQLILRTWSYQARPTAESHAASRALLEARLAAEENADILASLAQVYIVEHSLEANPLPDPLGRAMRAARRAIEIDRDNQEGWVNLALACFYSRDRAGFLESGEHAIALNPRNATATAWIGNMLTHTGEYDRGCNMTERAMVLNARHPGWYHFAPFNRHFARGDFEEARRAARRVNIPHFFWMYLTIAAACGHLGPTDEGPSALQQLIALKPSLADEPGRREYLNKWYWEPAIIESLLAGLRNAERR
jgi:tetratricopeptide (TPR) repeat protein